MFNKKQVAWFLERASENPQAGWKKNNVQFISILRIQKFMFHELIQLLIVFKNLTWCSKANSLLWLHYVGNPENAAFHIERKTQFLISGRFESTKIRIKSNIHNEFCPVWVCVAQWIVCYEFAHKIRIDCENGNGKFENLSEKRI